MTADEVAFLRRLDEDPHADFRRVARECGLSGRVARRLLAAHDHARLARADRRRQLALVVVALGVVIGASVALLRSREAPPPTQAPREGTAIETEHSLYAALDGHDPARVGEATASLSSPDEGVRLAALRYLAKVRRDEPTEAMLALVDDPSERVRPAALQLLGQLPGALVEGKLVAVATSPERALAERTLALSALTSRSPDDRLALGRSLLPCLRDPSAALRNQAADVLSQLTALRPDAGADLYDGWRRALGVAE